MHSPSERQNIPSQIWFFETFKQLAPAVFHGKRVIDAGIYTIELCDINYYLMVLPSEDLSAASTRPQGTKVIFRLPHSVECPMLIPKQFIVYGYICRRYHPEFQIVLCGLWAVRVISHRDRWPPRNYRFEKAGHRMGPPPPGTQGWGNCVPVCYISGDIHDANFLTFVYPNLVFVIPVQRIHEKLSALGWSPTGTDHMCVLSGPLYCEGYYFTLMAVT